MKIGLIDVDGHNYPNLPLMKLSAWHKAQGDQVEWYHPMFTGHCDKVYMSKVFSFTPDYEYFVDADEIQKGGSGYCISIVDGKEVFDKSKDIELPYEIEHIYPDYSLYPEETGYGKSLKQQFCFGFLSRGCPRGCDFCHVKSKEGQCSHKVADLKEFWRGQGHIELLDPNTLACPEWEDLLQQLIDSKARVNFNQGLDIRMMTDKKAEMLSQIPLDAIHFAWDRYEDKDLVLPRFEEFRKRSKVRAKDLQVYVLCNFNTTLEQDLERIYTLRSIGFAPYVMLYNKQFLPNGDIKRKLQRWVNNRFIFWKIDTFEEYLKGSEE